MSENTDNTKTLKGSFNSLKNAGKKQQINKEDLDPRLMKKGKNNLSINTNKYYQDLFNKLNEEYVFSIRKKTTQHEFLVYLLEDLCAKKLKFDLEEFRNNYTIKE